MEEYVEIVIRANVPPQHPVQHAYLVAQAEAAAPAVINAGAMMIRSGVTQVLAIQDIDAGIGKDPNRPNQPANGFQGVEVWLNGLTHLGVLEEQIMRVQGARVGGSYNPKNINTYTELMALCRRLAEINVTQIILVAPDFHLPRAMVSFITALRDLGLPDIWAWGRAVAVAPWSEQIVHSQGVLGGSVREIVEQEILKYAGPNRYQNLAPLDQVIEYFNRRDTAFMV